MRPPLSVSEYVQRLYAENDPLPREEGSPPSSCPASAGVSDHGALPRYRKPQPDGRRRKANNELVSRTDPEATVISRRGFGLHLAYKAHLAVAGKGGQVITVAVTTTGAKADEHLLGEMLWQHARLSRLPPWDICGAATEEA